MINVNAGDGEMNRIKSILMCAMLSYGSVNAESIIYTGLECELEPTKPYLTATSKFQVIQDLGNRNYNLQLTGGILVFKDEICIGDLGQIANEYTNFDIQDAVFIDAVGSFNNNELTITYGIMRHTGVIALNTTIFDAGITSPIIHTLTFDFIPDRQVFRLKKAVEIFGTISSIGFPELGVSTHGIDFFPIKTIIPNQPIEFYYSEK